MDIFMPKMNGLEATRRIMERCPTPIVIISSMVGSRDASFSFEAMRAGAIEVIEKPTGILSGKYQEIKRSLIAIIEKSVETRPGAQLSWLPSSPAGSPLAEERVSQTGPLISLSAIRPEVICIGGSTGAPTVIVEILRRLPGDYPVPILLAQHITRGFAPRMAEWLDASMELSVKMASPGAALTAGQALMCPDDQLLRISPSRRVVLSEADSPTLHIPNIDMLFASAAAVFRDRAMGIILSGMGRDGAEGIGTIHECGGLTIGQNEETSVVYGMNRVAGEHGFIDLVLPPWEIADTLMTIAGNF